MAQAYPIGIDLGTTYSCVAVWRSQGNGSAEIIANDMGNRTTPSYVSFSDEERLIGDAAKNSAGKNVYNTVFDAKRLIGRKFSDKCVQEDRRLWPFDVRAGPDDKPVIAVRSQGEQKTFQPEQIASMILGKMKETAEAYLGAKVTDACVTVPAYFNDFQRKATKDAAAICGLHVERVLNEPTAAALAYGLDRQANGEVHEQELPILIFDMGGGTFDVTVLTISGGVFEVKATKGDTHLGGEDFDSKIVQHCLDDFKRKHRDTDISSNAKALRRLRTQCERAKRTLSQATKTDIEVDALHDGHDYSLCLSRAKFEDLCSSYFKTALKCVEDCLKDSEVAKRDVHEIVLVGGSSRIPKVQNMLIEFFEGKEISKRINPDEAVAYGAAVQAALLSEMFQDDPDLKDIILNDVNPLSLGILKKGGLMSTIIERNQVLPYEFTRAYSPCADYMDWIEVKVYEGERDFCSDNNFLGKFNVTGLPRAPSGEVIVNVTFALDASGILTVTAEEKDQPNGAKGGCVIKSDTGRLSAEEVERMVSEAARFADEDEEQKIKVEARNGLENYCYIMRDNLDDKFKDKLDANDKRKIDKVLSDVLRWLERNLRPETHECEAKQMELESIVNPITMKTGGGGGGGDGGYQGGDPWPEAEEVD